MRKMIRLIWPLSVVLSATLTSVFTFGELSSPWRPLVIFWFLLVCPGLPFVRLLRLPGRIVEITLGVALSLALDMVTAEALVYAGVWSPKTALLILLFVTLTGLMLELRFQQPRQEAATTEAKLESQEGR